ncbi:hypothetical protein [Thermoactinospora rubra]|uniref:hypothetical protein n=1 Tax=Thermoactinospora rubra TaxID=1088767 RepID=UPI000A10D34B|nr:hypothetical protein [Thermoactinospora rubra]
MTAGDQGVVKAARIVAAAAIPAELAVLALPAAGVRLPAPAPAIAELAILLVAAFECWVLARLVRTARRGGLSRREALAAALRQAVPVAVRRLLAHEARLLASLGYWLARRRHGVRPGEQAFAYTGGQGATMLLFLFATLVEGGVLHVLVPWPAVRGVLLVLHVYSAVLIAGMIAACRVRPHVVGPGEVRIRYGAAFDLRIPRHLIAAARGGHTIHDGGLVRLAGGRLDLVVSAQTNLILELAEPVTVTRPLGRTGQASIIRIWADRPRDFLRALSIPSPGARHGGERRHT